ncbi:aldose epimerase family protein [Radiobacillus deserti]|uniref:Aldose 1-epimerase n=1 Tax=Radiobacillus deserti TaxID=2594883 RepID=A0A516KK74_9BACI|nr:aldose epimerase family protein [Radiobacillus deserti]QDP41794.1 galactose mutarotase [Radiobacillus deserti]
MEIMQRELSIPYEEPITEYTLKNDRGMEVSCLNLGGIITKILVPDRYGTFENVVLGFKDKSAYLENPPFLGALVGRVAGRIQSAQFELDGKNYTLEANDGPNHLHGGASGFHRVVWQVEPKQTENDVQLVFTYFSPDGEGGYPGNLHVNVTYSLNNANEFTILYEATSDKKTALTLTNHSYFNLSGNLKTDILAHDLQINSDVFVELDEALIPTGNLLDVTNTSYDFRSNRTIKEGMEASHPQNKIAGNGYDHYFILNNQADVAAIVREPISGRTLTVQTEQPGFVMYTSNMLPEDLELVEGASRKYLGLCLETQASPASLHHSDGFPSVILDKDEQYSKKTTFIFGVE